MANRTYDTKKLWSLIEEAKGENLSYKEFAKMLDVDQTTISKIKNGSYKPGKKLLKRIADKSTSEDISLELLMRAAGYQESEIDKELMISAAAGMAMIAGAIPEGIGILPSVIVANAMLSKSTKALKQYYTNMKTYQRNQRQFQALAFSIVYRALSEKDYKIIDHEQVKSGAVDKYKNMLEDYYSKDQKEGNEKNWYISDRFTIETDTIKQWDFIYIDGDNVESVTRKTPYAEYVDAVMSQLLYSEPKQNNTTLVISNEKCYEEFVKLKGKVSLKKNLSVILVDKETIEIKKEDVIAVFSEREMEILSVRDAADIWMSSGKDEDYMFGYTREELEDTL